MSATSRWSYKNVATVWPMGERDDWAGGAEVGEPYTIKCTWTAKSERRTDSGGQEFVSTIDFFHEDQRVKYGDMIVMGDATASVQPTDEARQIRGHVNWDMMVFDDPMPDFRSTT